MHSTCNSSAVTTMNEKIKHHHVEIHPCTLCNYFNFSLCNSCFTRPAGILHKAK
jgi:hypothetical protein